MRFVLLGTGTTLPDPERGPAGFLVEEGAARILVDGGSGTIQRLARHGVDARDLDGGVYTHRHLDHCADLAPLLFTLRVGIDKPRTRDYPIWAGEGFADYLAALRALYPTWLESERFAAPVTELPLDAPGHAQLPGGVRLDTRPAKHGLGALHLSFTAPDGWRVVFSGDTGWSDALVELSRGADVLVCECAANLPSEHDHLNADEVAAVCAAARPHRVVLTHFYPGVDPAAAQGRVRSTGVPVERGFDGQVLTP